MAEPSRGRHSAAPSAKTKGAKTSGAKIKNRRPHRTLSWFVLALLILGAIAGIVRFFASTSDPTGSAAARPTPTGGIDATSETITQGTSSAPVLGSAPIRPSVTGKSTGSSPNNSNGAVPVLGVDNPVWPGAPYGHSAVRVTVSTTRPRAGSPITITISGVIPGHGIDVTIPLFNGATTLGTLLANGSGAAAQVFTVPAGLSGKYTLEVSDAVAGGTSSIPITVIAAKGALTSLGSVAADSSGAGSSDPASPDADASTSGGVDPTNVTIAGDPIDGGIGQHSWGWDDTEAAAVAVLIFGLPCAGIALLFLGRRSRKWPTR